MKIMKSVLTLFTLVVITQGCATVSYKDPASKKEVRMNTYLKEVSVAEIKAPDGSIIVKDFESKNALKWLDSLIGGLSDTARGILGVRGSQVPIEFNFPTPAKETDSE